MTRSDDRFFIETSVIKKRFLWFSWESRAETVMQRSEAIRAFKEVFLNSTAPRVVFHPLVFESEASGGSRDVRYTPFTLSELDRAELSMKKHPRIRYTLTDEKRYQWLRSLLEAAIATPPHQVVYQPYRTDKEPNIWFEEPEPLEMLGNWVDKSFGKAAPTLEIPDPIRISREEAWAAIEPDLHRFVGYYDPTDQRAAEPREIVLSLIDPEEAALYWGGVY